MVANPVVTFDPTAFKAGFAPVFNAVTDPQLQFYFTLAQLFFQNNTCNLAFPDETMPSLYNLLVAHIAMLLSPRDASGNPSSSGTQPAMIVGRISSATEGSVSVSSELTVNGGPSEAWFTQTSYGFMFWQATAQYRTAVYVPGSPWPTPYVPGPLYAGYGRRWRQGGW